MHNTNLKSLRLPLRSHMIIPSLHSLLLGLCTLESPHLSELSIPLSPLPDEKWDNLDRLFSLDSRFASLQRLVLGFPVWFLEKDYLCSVKLPLTRQKIVVEVRAIADL
jgi:hypothetical protein